MALERRVQAACHGSATLLAVHADTHAFFVAPRNMKVALFASVPLGKNHPCVPLTEQSVSIEISEYSGT